MKKYVLVGMVAGTVISLLLFNISRTKENLRGWIFSGTLSIHLQLPMIYSETPSENYQTNPDINKHCVEQRDCGFVDIRW